MFDCNIKKKLTDEIYFESSSRKYE
jgi:hypothetical protein